jgi:5-methylcytosine-specific restriction endonuclease McrA
MPGARKCEPGCRCGHHPDGMMTPGEYALKRRDKERHRQREKRYPGSNRKNTLRSIHDMSTEDYAAMHEAQGGLCCYCERPLSENTRHVHIDHNHACDCGPKKSCKYCRRGLACQNCNFVVGNAGDDPDRLELIAKNLRQLNAESDARLNGRPMQIELITMDDHAA